MGRVSCPTIKASDDHMTFLGEDLTKGIANAQQCEAEF